MTRRDWVHLKLAPIIVTAVLFLLLLAGSSVSGKALGADIRGVAVRPIDDMFVKNCIVQIDKDGKFLGNTRTDNLGKFSFDNLEDGSYELLAIADEYSYDFVFSTYAISEKYSVQIKGGRYDGPPIILKLRIPQIWGTVIDSNLQYPKAWTCSVVITNPKTGWKTWDPVFDNGEFHTAGLPDGEYSIFANQQIDGRVLWSENCSFEIKDGKYIGPDLQFTLAQRMLQVGS